MKSFMRILSVVLAVVTLVPLMVFAPPAAEAAQQNIDMKTFEENYKAFIDNKNWKHDSYWGYYQRPKYTKKPVWSGIGCCAYVIDFSAQVYGEKGTSKKAPWKTAAFTPFKKASEIRAGDIIHTKEGEGHWFVVLSRTGNTLYTAEGNIAYTDTDRRVRVSKKAWKIDGDKLVVNGKTTRTIETGYHYNFSGFTLHFDANGGTGTMQDQTVPYGINKPTPKAAFTRPGYVFSHWEVNRGSDNKWYCIEKVRSGKTEKGGWYAENEIPDGYKIKEYPDQYSFCWCSKDSTEQITVRAQWKKSYTVRYEAAGGKGTMEDTVVTYGEDTVLPLATFTKSGYAVAGWNVFRESDGKWYYRNKEGKGKWCHLGTQPAGYSKAVYKNGTTVSKTSSVPGDVVHLVAVWKKAYTVRYEPNGGTGTMEDTTVIYGQNTKIPLCSFTRSGYEFVGWNVYRKSDGKWFYRDKNGNGKWYKENKQPSGYSKAVYKNGTTVAKTSSVAGDIVQLFAVWNRVGGAVEEPKETHATTPKETTPVQPPKEETVPTEAIPTEAIPTDTVPTEPKEDSTEVTEEQKKETTLSVKNLLLPPAKLAKGSAFTIAGVVTSQDAIRTVTVTVSDRSSGKVAFSASAKPNSKSYSLYGLDSKMTFSKLAAGNYVLKVTATDDLGTKTLVEHNFASVAADIKSSGMVYPSGTLKKGNTFCVKGTVSAAAKVAKVELSVYSADGRKMFSASAKPNAAKYNVYNLDSKMTFRQLPAGSYVYRVAVTDGNGVTRYAVSMSFTVK